MKTKEFIRRVIDLNPCWQVHENGGSITVLNEEKCKVAVVSQTEAGLCKTWLSRVPEPFPYLLANLVRDFALTPLAEREDEKKYYVKVFNSFEGFLYVYADCVMLSARVDDSRGQFTQKDIDELKQRYDIPLDWDKVKLIEVEDKETIDGESDF